MTDPGYVARGHSGPFYIGHDRQQVERESGGKAAPVHNVTQADIDRLTKDGSGVVIICDEPATVDSGGNYLERKDK
jgi:hypothetical protein